MNVRHLIPLLSWLGSDADRRLELAVATGAAALFLMHKYNANHKPPISNLKVGLNVPPLVT